MLIIGHRGARGLAPENTLEGIKAALAAHADGVEIDVRVTSDDIVVVSHNPYIIDTAGHKWTLSQHTYDFLRKRVPALPTLKEILDHMPSSCLLRIEIKPGEPVAPLAAIVRPYIAQSRQMSIAVISFDFKLLMELHHLLPDLPIILNEKWSSIRARIRAKRLGTKQIQMNQRWLWRGFLKAMWRGGYLVTPYTVNNPAQAKRWKPYIEGIITDYPDRFI